MHHHHKDQSPEHTASAIALIFSSDVTRAGAVPGRIICLNLYFAQLYELLTKRQQKTTALQNFLEVWGKVR
jgi:hypothetical protein